MKHFRTLAFVLPLVSILNSIELDADEPLISQVEFRRTGMAIVEGAIGSSKDVSFIIDTGSQTCLVDESWAERGLVGYETFEQKVTTIGGTSVVRFAREVPISLGGESILRLDTAVVDLSEVARTLDRDVAVVGMPYLTHHILEFSERNGCRILPEFPQSERRGIRLPMRISRLRPEIEIELPGLGKRWVLFDTGSTGSVSLNSQRIASLRRMGHLVDGTETWAVDAKGQLVKTNSYILRRIEFGGVVFHNVDVDESEFESIGLQILHRFHLILDFSTEQVFLSHEGNGKVDSVAPNAAGVAVGIKRNGCVQIFKIRDQSAAFQSGLTVNDEITMIDGKESKSLGHWQLQEVLSQAGKTIPMTVLREGKEMSMEMTLRHSVPFPPDWPPEKPEFNPEP